MAIRVFVFVVIALVVLSFAVTNGLVGLAAQECVFDASRKDDNYCDCPLTGEDEPSTGACAPVGLFKCRDRPVNILASRVRDGVCDCCDGSDEAPGECRNECEELDRIERQRKAELEERKQLGERGFLDLMSEAKALACVDEAPPAPPGGGDDDTVSFEELDKAERAVKQLEEEANAATRKARIDSLRLDRLSREALVAVLVDLATQTHSGVTLERLISKALNCHQPDIAEDLPLEEDALASEDALTSDEEETPSDDDEDEVETETEAKSEEDEEEAEDEGNCPEIEWGSAPLPSPELSELRAKAESMRARYDSLNSVNDDEDVEYDYGPAKIWLALKKKCFVLKKEQYEYQLCVMDEFRQDHTRLGKFKRWGQPYTEMSYENGDRCFSPSQPRSITVKVECGAKNELVDVSEPSTCVYEAHFRTPAACVPDNVAALEQSMCAAA